MFRHFRPAAGAAGMITTGVITCLGYSYSNRHSVVCKATSTHCLLQGLRQTGFEAGRLLAKRVLVFGIRVSPVPKR